MGSSGMKGQQSSSLVLDLVARMEQRTVKEKQEGNVLDSINRTTASHRDAKNQ